MSQAPGDLPSREKLQDGNDPCREGPLQRAGQVIESALGRMVGVTGIEPVTPTMTSRHGLAVSVPLVALEFRNKTEETHHRACGFPSPVRQAKPAAKPSSKKVPTPQLSA
jgi:hypothetical protein